MGYLNLKVMMDNQSLDDTFDSEHGLSFWIEYDDKKVIFDTGQSPLFMSNAARMDINLKTADAVVISHGHYDHTGGLLKLMNSDFKSEIYIHPNALAVRYSAGPCKVKNVSMPQDSAETIKFLERKGYVVWTSMPTTISSKIMITGQIPRVNDFEDTGGQFFYDMSCIEKDEIIDDQAMFIETDKGLVVILGCSHAGLINTLEYIVRLSSQKNIYAILGGMHLNKASDSRIEKTIQALKRFAPQLIAPSHCTGKKAVTAIKNEFGDKVISLASGQTISL